VIGTAGYNAALHQATHAEPQGEAAAASKALAGPARRLALPAAGGGWTPLDEGLGGSDTAPAQAEPRRKRLGPAARRPLGANGAGRPAGTMLGMR
jgi:hypothetical protein